jgi:flagellar biosynthetic protein FliR
MQWLYAYGTNAFIVFTLVLSRLSGLMMTAPIYGSMEVPIRVRAMLVLALSLLVAPSQISQTAEAATLIDYGVLAVGELAIGLVLGLGVQILFLAPQVAGQLVSQMSGIALADVFNPTLDSEIPVFSQLLYLFSLAIFMIIGGHRLVMAGLLETFDRIPPGQASLWTTFSDSFSTLVAQSLELGLRAAAPTVMALLLATLVMGLISRTVPQLNVMSLGFGVSAITTLVVLSASLGGIAWALEGQVEPFIENLVESVMEGARSDL